jgi:hypothetical protein
MALPANFEIYDQLTSCSVVDSWSTGAETCRTVKSCRHMAPHRDDASTSEEGGEVSGRP